MDTSDNIYYLGNLIEEANADSFEIINRIYAKDDTHIYHSGEKIKNSDALSFQFNEDYSNPYSAEDDNSWYYAGIIISKTPKKELFIEWKEAQPFESFKFLTENLSTYEGWIDVYCNNVGWAKNEEYKNWHLISCNRISSSMGYTYAHPIRFLFNSDTEKYRVLSLFNHEVWTEEPELKENLVVDYFISDLLYPDEIIVDGKNGSVIFNRPSRLMFLGYSESYNHQEDKKIFFKHNEWGALYQDNTMTGIGGVIVRTQRWYIH